MFANIYKATKYLLSLTLEGTYHAAKALGHYSWSWLFPSPAIPFSQREEQHKQKVEQIRRQFQELDPAQQVAQGGKSTTHLFRPRNQVTKRLDMSALNSVIRIDTEKMIAHIEGMASFDAISEELLKQWVLPKVVPELLKLTLGGTISGLGVESSSFKYGLVHESVLEMEVLTGDGQVVTCTKDNAHSDLFHALPNSYGTLGYVLSAKISLIKVAPYVKVRYHHFSDFQEYFKELETLSQEKDSFDFIDGAIFSPEKMVIVVGQMSYEVPKKPFNPHKEVFYKAIQEKDSDEFTIQGYLERWNCDLFWATEIDGNPTILQNPTFRKWLGGPLLRSDRLAALSRLRYDFLHHVVEPFQSTPQTTKRESLIQDVGVQIEKCAEFMEWYSKEIAIFPVWICPVESPDKKARYPLWDFNGGKLACDIGFYSSKVVPSDTPKGHYNKMVEEKLKDLGSIKSLYSDSFYSKQDFDALFAGNGDYPKIKAKYDPNGRFPTLYEKCVQNK